MKNVHLIPTDKPSRLINNDANQLCYQSNKSFKNDRKWMYRKKFNIYITSDEEIKLGDWFISGSLIHKATDILDCDDDGNLEIHSDGYCNPLSLVKKIILTTDQDLIKDGVQNINDEFLEWFVENPSCEEVKIESWQTKGEWDLDYKIIIPKEEPKQELPYWFETQEWKQFSKLAENNSGDKPKQEILEEAARDYIKGDDLSTFSQKAFFIAGAKWQQERMYSEEEVKQIIDTTLIEYSDFVLADIPHWFEQFKKK